MKINFLFTLIAKAAETVPTLSPPIGSEDNPLKESITNWFDLLNLVADVLIYLAGIIFIGMFLFGGVQYLTARGEQGEVEKAKKTLLWAVYGILAVLSAFVIVNLIIGAVK